MSASTAIWVAILLPLLGMLLIALTGRYANLRDGLLMLVSVVTFGVVWSLLPEVMAGGRPQLVVADILPGLSLAFQVEPLGMVFALIASGLWIVTSLYAIGYMRGHHEENQTRFFAFFSFAITAALGVAFARNMFTLFIFYEVLTFSTYPLVTHHRTEEAKRGGRVYLGILVSTSVSFLLLAMVWTWYLTGTLEFKPGGILSGNASDGVVMVLLALYAFGTGKAALMPFHKWLPSAMVAPTPVSALLHAVAVVKAGVFTVMKVVVYVFGTDLLSTSGGSIWLMYVAGFTIVVGSLVAMTKDNLKARLAYSTISQLSYIVLGAALANEWGVIGGSMHIAMHAFGKITLFFCAGAIMVATHKTNISDMDGIGRIMPVTIFGFFIGSLSVIGVPPMGGSWSKWYLALGSADAHQTIFVVVLMVSSLLNIAYLMPIVARGFFLPVKQDAHHPIEGIHEAPLFCVVPICLTALGCVVMFFYAGDLYQLLMPLVRP